MLVRRDAPDLGRRPPGLSFRDWLRLGSAGGPGPPPADRRRPRLPPDDPVPARPAQGLPRSPVHRRPARRMVDRADRRHRCAARGRAGGGAGAGCVRAGRAAAGGTPPGSGWAIRNCARAANAVLLAGRRLRSAGTRDTLRLAEQVEGTSNGGPRGADVPPTTRRAPLSRRHTPVAPSNAVTKGMSRHDRSASVRRPPTAAADAGDPAVARGLQEHDRSRATGR